jgi:serine/threonine protein kinase
MITGDGRVKVLDFGLAKVKHQSEPSADAGVVSTKQLTADQHVTGTPAYMSPEQAEGRPIDARSDVFSLGVTLYEMATGTRPFRGGSPLSIISSILKDAPSPLAAVRPELPPDLDRIVRRCLAKELTRRYQTALDVRNELEDLQRQLASGAVASSPPGALRSMRLKRVAAIVGALAATGVGVYMYMSWPFARETSTTPLHATFSRITSQPGNEFFPSLSPDGRWIIYSGEVTGNRDIYLQSVSGQAAINLTPDSPENDEQPSFSPDGEHIAFRSGRDGGGIFVMGRTGEAVRRITREGFNPAWSKDGTTGLHASPHGNQTAERGRTQ